MRAQILACSRAVDHSEDVSRSVSRKKEKKHMQLYCAPDMCPVRGVSRQTKKPLSGVQREEEHPARAHTRKRFYGNDTLIDRIDILLLLLLLMFFTFPRRVVCAHALIIQSATVQGHTLVNAASVTAK